MPSGGRNDRYGLFIRSLQRLREIDRVDLTAWSFADPSFAFLVGICDFLPWAASTFPTPRRRHRVPAWMELCCAIHMALAEEPAFSGLTYFLQAGPILTRVKLSLLCSPETSAG